MFLIDHLDKNPEYILKHWKVISDDLKLTAEGKVHESVFA